MRSEGLGSLSDLSREERKTKKEKNSAALSFKLLDAGFSIGANLEEGRAGQTKPEFIAKHFISLKESRETRFWLRVIAATDPYLVKELQPFLQEATEFVAMLTATLKTARSSTSRGSQDLQR